MPLNLQKIRKLIGSKSQSESRYPPGGRQQRLGFDWASADGDNWIDSVGRPIQSKIFDNMPIILIGGFRDGEMVA